jgi:outer membrane protein assembly factor BamB
MIFRLIILCLTACLVARAEMIPPDVQVSLERIDPLNGKTVWSSSFDRKLRPYRCEVYTNGVVTFFYSLKKRGTRDVFFFDTKSGQKISPFDTRDFIWPEEDPLIARSGSQGSVNEERSEISLPNGWRSRGIAGLSWRNSGSNTVYFFQGSFLKWAMTLPDGAYNLSHWKNILIYSRGTEQDKTLINTLYAQPVGSGSTIWNFSLPSDIPSKPWASGDFFSDKMIRSFSYSIGKKYIFTFGGGTLFALDPQTGKVMWRHRMSDDSVIRDDHISIENAEILEGSAEVFLFSKNALVQFDLNSRSTAAVVRKNVYEGLKPIIVDGAIYCFTQRP